jgi:exonuclease VII small subunit
MPHKHELVRRRERLERAIAYFEKHSKHERTSAQEFLGWAERQLVLVLAELDQEECTPLAEPASRPEIRSLN